MIIRISVQQEIRKGLDSDLDHSLSTFHNIANQRNQMLSREAALLADLPSLKAPLRIGILSHRSRKPRRNVKRLSQEPVRAAARSNCGGVVSESIGLIRNGVIALSELVLMVAHHVAACLEIKRTQVCLLRSDLNDSGALLADLPSLKALLSTESPLRHQQYFPILRTIDSFGRD